MKCQILFSGKNKKNNIILSSAENAQRVVKVNKCSALCLVLVTPFSACSSAAKRSTNSQYVCKYIGCINDQSNWSGPFSLVVRTLDYRSRGTWFDPRSGHSEGIFSLQVYFSSYYIWCLVPG